jgi:YVTN family beta-propeller protein
MSVLDLRGRPLAECGGAVIARFNASRAGDRFDVLISEFPTGLRIGLLEAGACHDAVRESDGAWRLTLHRRQVPAQGSIPGLHHVVPGHGDSVWCCERAHRVARIDAETGRLAAVRDVARKASHLALDEPEGRLFVADAESAEIIALRAGDLAEVARWQAPGMPQLPLVSPDGVVCVTGGASGTVTIAWPNGATYRSRTFQVGAAPHDPGLSRDGEYLFVPCAGDGQIVKMRMSDGVIVGRISVGAGPSHLAFHPDGRRLYSANSWDGTVSCVTVDGERAAHAFSGGWAHAIETSPDGQWVYVANFRDATVSVFDTRTLERAALLETDCYPHGLDVSPDGMLLVATGFGSDHLRIFDAQAHREVARIEVGWGSSHTAFARDGAAWVGCSVSDHLACVDLASFTCRSPLRLIGDGAAEATSRGTH